MTELHISLVGQDSKTALCSGGGWQSEEGGAKRSAFSCAYCQATFTSLDDLAQHKLARHLTLRDLPAPSSRHGRLKSEKERRSLGAASLGEAGYGTAVHDDASVLGVKDGFLLQDAEGACGMAKMTPCVCPVCNKFFRYTYNLRRHLNTHSTYFAYRCCVCGKGFHRSDFMQRHVRTVHKNLIDIKPQIWGNCSCAKFLLLWSCSWWKINWRKFKKIEQFPSI